MLGKSTSSSLLSSLDAATIQTICTASSLDQGLEGYKREVKIGRRFHGQLFSKLDIRGAHSLSLKE
jgi:hypothetical protein